MNYTIDYTIKDLLEASVHFGHRKKHWHPEMAKYIYGIKDNIHIIDLQKTAVSLYKALKIIYKVASNGGKILFANTKKQSTDVVKKEALRCNQYFINNRWLGGTLTNWLTVSSSIKTLEHYEELCKNHHNQYTKKEVLTFNRKREKIDNDIGGVRNMGGLPDLMFIMDVRTHSIAVEEAKKCSIPIVGIVDTNSSPKDIDFIIPGNDDSRKSIELYCRLVSDVIISANNIDTINEKIDKKSKNISVTKQNDNLSNTTNV